MVQKSLIVLSIFAGVFIGPSVEHGRLMEPPSREELASLNKLERLSQISCKNIYLFGNPANIITHLGFPNKGLYLHESDFSLG